MAVRELPRGGSYGNVNYQTTQLAKIKSIEDQAHSGKIKVWLMSSNTDENDPDSWITVKYASPFAGVSNPTNVDSQAVESPSGTQRSYGFFAVPPDPENVVLVNFANGEPDKGYFISCTFQDTMTQMVPGTGKANTYQGDEASAEVNRYSQQVSSPESTPTRPSIEGFPEKIEEQGITDDELGAGDSSVWRDLAPTVQGWLTPSGHQIVFDDKTGLVRLRAANGAQFLITGSSGDVFIINSTGNGVVRMGAGGEFDVYGSTSVNIFGGTDVNVKSTNINLEGETINIKGTTTNIEGGTLNLKGSINSSFINGDVAFARTAGGAPIGSPSPVGDTAGSAGSVTRTPTRGGNAE